MIWIPLKLDLLPCVENEVTKIIEKTNCFFF